MKKTIPFTLIFFIFFLFSCSYSPDVYEPLDNIYDEGIISKTSMKPFDHLENPIVLTTDHMQYYAPFKNKNLGMHPRKKGDVIFVYDTQKEEIFDWVFVEHSGFSYSCIIYKVGTPAKYYLPTTDENNYIYELNPQTGKITKEKHKYTNKIYSCDAHQNNNYFFMANELNEEVDLYSYNTETSLVSQNVLKIKGKDWAPSRLITDPDGTFWLMYVDDTDNWLVHINPKNNEIIEEYNIAPRNEETTSDLYSSTYATKDYVFFKDTTRIKDSYLHYFDKTTGNCEKILLNMPRKFNYIWTVVDVDGVLYAIACETFCKVEGSTNEEDWEENRYIFKLDMQNKTATYLSKADVWGLDSPIVIGSKIYMIHMNSYYRYYDTATNTWGEKTKFEISDKILSDLIEAGYVEE